MTDIYLFASLLADCLTLFNSSRANNDRSSATNIIINKNNNKINNDDDDDIHTIFPSLALEA